MARFNVTPDKEVVVVPLGSAEGKLLRTLQLFQSGDVLTVDLRLDEELSLELLRRDQVALSPRKAIS